MADRKVTSSQPSPGAIMDLWELVLDTADEIIYIPMSCGLSGSYQSAVMLADDFDGGNAVLAKCEDRGLANRDFTGADWLWRKFKPAWLCEQSHAGNCQQKCVFKKVSHSFFLLDYAVFKICQSICQWIPYRTVIQSSQPVIRKRLIFSIDDMPIRIKDIGTIGMSG